MKNIFIIISLFLIFSGCSEEQVKESDRELRIETLPQVQQVRPEKPVKIKLKRDIQGRYSWELSGDNPEEIIKIDKRLRKAFIPEQSGQ
ncbi:MAG: hypothetical protein N2257_00350 [Thermodesulfovibrionales bacterium]|nr:hypothetical protein [Thermodesulfovibrionales bacterium]